MLFKSSLRRACSVHMLIQANRQIINIPGEISEPGDRRRLPARPVTERFATCQAEPLSKPGYSQGKFFCTYSLPEGTRIWIRSDPELFAGSGFGSLLSIDMRQTPASNVILD
jgi:hypothetical protein